VATVRLAEVQLALAVHASPAVSLATRASLEASVMAAATLTETIALPTETVKAKPTLPAVEPTNKPTNTPIPRYAAGPGEDAQAEK